MDREEIIRMAREAGFCEPNPHDGYMGLAYDYRDGTDTGASLERFFQAAYAAGAAAGSGYAADERRAEGSMSTHTLGPWIVGPVNRGPVAGTIPVTTPDYMKSHRTGQLVCSVYGTAAFSERNARLIAAAPDLLHAIDLCLDAMLHDGVPPDPEHPARVALTAARNAYFKATGQKI